MVIIEVSNTDRLVKRLEGLRDADYSDAITKGCLMIENDAKVNCPVKTGLLRSSITHEVKGNEGQVGSNIEYAPYVRRLNTELGY